MLEKFVDTLSEKVMVVITVDIIPTFKNHQKLQANIKACAGMHLCVSREQVPLILGLDIYTKPI